MTTIVFVIHRRYAVDSSHRNFAAALASHQVYDDWGNAVCQNANASFIWMKALRLIEPPVLRDALEKKRVERHARGTGEIRENPIERGAVFFAPIRRCPHPGQQQPRATRLYFGDYPIQIGVNFRRLDSAQRIVRTQTEYDERGFLVGKDRIHTGEAAGGSIARYSRVYYRTASPSARNRASSWAGNAAFGGTPSPAVKLSPKTRITVVPGAAMASRNSGPDITHSTVQIARAPRRRNPR